MTCRPVVGRWSIPFGLACMVVAFAAGSSSSTWVKNVGLDARWFVLFGVGSVAGVAALAQIWRERTLPPRGLLRIGAFAAAFPALAVASTAWSAAPRLTLERAISLALLFGLAAALASSTARDTVARLRALQGVAAGAIAVGFLGLVMLVVDHDAAVQQPTALSPWRFRGFTENPNTISILAAASVPIITGLAIRATGRPRALWTAGALLLIGSTVAAESRGPLLAAFMGVCVVFLFAFPAWRPRLVGVTAALLVFVGGTALREVTQPAPPAFTSAVVQAPPPNAAPGVPPLKTTAPHPKANASRPHANSSGSSSSGKTRGRSQPNASQPSGQGKTAASSTTPSKEKTGAPTQHKTSGKKPAESHAKTTRPHAKTAGPHAKQAKPRAKATPHKKRPPAPRVFELPRAQDEIGHPFLTKKNVSTAGSGRVAAWLGALELIRERPILGYGFGTEARVFVDRWYYFQGGTTENSYLGLMLQLGVLGLGLILALGLALLIRGVTTVRALDDEARPIVASLLGVLVSAAGVMLIQSFLYSVGNVATATVWIALFLLGTVVLEPTRQPEAVLVPAPEERGALVA